VASLGSLLRTAAAALAAIAAAPAEAAEGMPWLHEVFVKLQNTGDTMIDQVDAALTSGQIATVVHVLFTALALILFVWKFAGFATRGFDLVDLLELMFTIFFVFLLLTGYRSLMPGLAAAGRYIGDVLGKHISGADGSQTLAESIFTEAVQMSLHPVCAGLLDCIHHGAYAIATAMAGDLAILILGAVATIIETWMHWCFAAVYGIGWFTIPFLLFRQLSFIFDGWLKLFFTVLFYDIIAKVTLAIVLLCFKIMEGQVPGATGASIDVHGPYDLIALFLFIVIGVLIMSCTGRFANAVTAGVSGAGGWLQDVSRGAARSAGAF